MQSGTSIALTVNGKFLEVPSSIDPATKLVDYLRAHALTKSVKVGCGEGGCGACAVEVTKHSPQTGEITVKSVNSCLAPLASVDGCSVVTAEGLGNKKNGFGAIQERIAGFHGSQCGFCTPGMVVACHTVLHDAQQQGRAVTPRDMEAALDGNLCRCTGYRPILDACKSFAGGIDIEDMGVRVADLCMNGADPVVKPVACPHTNGSNVGKVFSSPSRTWYAPASLEELWKVLGSAGEAARKLRVIGGGTGAGIYKNWISDEDVVVSVTGVAEMRTLEIKEDSLFIGGAVTIAEVISLLDAQAGEKLPTAAYWRPISSHLQRIAGHHVRNAATLGGHFSLCVSHALESDVATVFLAAGATLCLDDGKTQRWVSLENFLGGDQPGLKPMELVVALQLPLPVQDMYFYSDRLAQRYYNSHSFVNIAVSCKSGDHMEGVRVVLACHKRQTDGTLRWCCHRLAEVEAALEGRPASASVIAAALDVIENMISNDGHVENDASLVIPGMLLQALAPITCLGPAPSSPTSVLDVVPLGPPPLVQSKQTFPPPQNADQAPVWQPIMKDKAALQASGEAMFTGDTPLTQGALFGAFVLSTDPLAKFEVDASAALATPGVVDFITVKDIPGKNEVPVFIPGPEPEPVFADGEVQYSGQPIGLVVATSQSVAELGASRVCVTYVRHADQQPILTLQDAIDKDSKHQLLPFLSAPLIVGDVAAALEAGPRTIKEATWQLPSQQHFYMEPMVAVAEPNEEGGVKVWSSCQGTDLVQKAVSQALDVKFTNVTAMCRRLGGSFGAKVSRNLPTAVAASVAAVKLGQQVHIENNRNNDLRMVGGRCETKVVYDVAFTDEGRITGVRMEVWAQAGPWQDLALMETMLIVHGLDQAYWIPNLSVCGSLMRTNVPPRTTMRGPGHFQAGLLAEHVVEHVAAECGLNPTTVREINFIQPAIPTVPPSPPPAGQSTAKGENNNISQESSKIETNTPQSTHGLKENGVNHAPQDGHQQNGTADGNGVAQGCPKPEEDAFMLTSAGKKFPLSDYTLPKIWQHLKAKSEYEARAAEVEKFNEKHLWMKKGIAITPCRYDMIYFEKRAAVSIYGDGSVVVACGGAEMGQGLFTKVKQVAVSELSQALPPHLRPLPLDLVRIADQNSELLPHAGVTGGSTSSTGCAEAVRSACRELVGRLQPLVAAAGDEATWAGVCGTAIGGMGDKLLMSHYSGHWGTRTDEGKQDQKLTYNVYGAAVSEVLIDVLTGDRRVLRSDMLFDCGDSINPAVDIGQIEGAFLQGLGYVMQEEVKVDPISGENINSSTWNYKIPSAACIPRELYVHMLKDSPNGGGVMSSKAIGEPPTLASSSVMIAMQRAIAAAMKQLGSGSASDAVMLSPPFGPMQVREAMGKASVAAMLREALSGRGQKQEVHN